MGDQEPPIQGGEGRSPQRELRAMPLIIRHLAAAVLPLSATAAGILAVGIAVQLPEAPSTVAASPPMVRPLEPVPGVVARLSAARRSPGAGNRPTFFASRAVRRLFGRRPRNACSHRPIRHDTREPDAIPSEHREAAVPAGGGSAAHAAGGGSAAHAAGGGGTDRPDSRRGSGAGDAERDARSQPLHDRARPDDDTREDRQGGQTCRQASRAGCQEGRPPGREGCQEGAEERREGAT